MHLGGNNQKFDYFMGSHKLEADLGVWIVKVLDAHQYYRYLI